MAFDGMRALIVGDYVTPSRGSTLASSDRGNIL